MTLSRLVNLICIVVGGSIAIYTQAEKQQDTYLLMGGIVLLMFGIYRISRKIPSKYERDDEEGFVKTEKDEED